MATFNGTAYDGPTATGAPVGLDGSSVDPSQATVAYSQSVHTRVSAPSSGTRTADEWPPVSETVASVSGLEGDSVAVTQSTGAFTPAVYTRVSAPSTGPHTAEIRGGVTAAAAGISGLDGDSVAPIQSTATYTPMMHTRVSAPSSGTRTAGERQPSTAKAVTVTGLAGDGIAPSQSANPFTDLLGQGSVIPTSYFRKVEGRVLDEDGEAISNAIYIAALDNFAVVGNVTDTGAFIIYLLKQSYTKFILVADAGENESTDAEFDYVWYESEGNPSVGTSADYVELAFDTAVPETGRPIPTGLNIAGDLTFK